MIKVCSLDFLNNEFFEADVKTANGTVLCNSGDKITPEMILKLYFKDIYIEQPVEEKIPVSTTNSTDELVELEASRRDYVDGPVATNNVIDGVLGVTKEKTVEEISEEPAFVELASEEDGVEVATGAFGSVSLNGSKVGGEKTHKARVSVEEEVDESVPNPDDMPLEFDKEEAQRIVGHSVRIGKMLNYSPKELSELEQVAYNYNIGITKFKKGDLKQKGFRKKKVFASYNELVKQDLVSNDVAEAVKYCANRYESEAFPLNSKIPYHHIVAIGGYYEESLSLGNSKSATLLDMLQTGGHRFNIFILHKFIKMMREDNE